MIRILKASAGSGKTFQLARTYIRLLLESDDPGKYSHILAVTFTNKATDQMKTRIINELYILANDPQKSGYIKEFEREFGSAVAVSEKAGSCLRRILHDYSAFSVSTIDKFFQRTLKAFAREIGHFASYQVELDTASLVQESVDRILDSLSDDNPQMLRWLTDSMISRMREGERYSLEKNLYKEALELNSEEHREAVERSGVNEARMYSRDELKKLEAACTGVIRDFSSRANDISGKITDLMRAASLEGSDFSGGSRSFIFSATRMYKPEFRPDPDLTYPSPSALEKFRDPDKWFTGANREKFLPRLSPLFADAMASFADLFDPSLPDYRVYRTASLLKGQAYGLGIAAELRNQFLSLLKEKNVMSIDESNVILRDIIGGSDAPFVYEKLGVRFENFLMDEFQDTSAIQWENFRPLLKESESGGFEDLIVGDVKQSIYRWRGSDWNLLDSKVMEEFPDAREDDPLTGNRRSLANIVEFNNSFFAHAARLIDSIYGDGNLAARTYANARQEVKQDKDRQEGCVRVMFTSGDEIPLVLDSVGRAVKDGASLGDITVLVRNNAEGAVIAASLVGKGYPVVSDDSLKVKASVTVRRLVSLLSYLDNPNDKVNGYLAAALDVEKPSGYHSLVDVCESFVRTLRDYDPDLYRGETLYIQSFMDLLQEWVSRRGNNLPEFLKFWRESTAKISSPDSSAAVRVMTIHKAKGLEFPYLIFPFAENVTLFKSDGHWCHPEVEGTALEGVADGVFRVNLSSSSESTLFAGDYRKELMQQYIDNLNVFYVALTRAEKNLDIIAQLPTDKFISDIRAGKEHKYGNFSQILYSWLLKESDGMETWKDNGEGFRTEYFMKGTGYDFHKMGKEKMRDGEWEYDYVSFPLCGRLAVKADSADFFSDGGDVGARASDRLRGTVLHGILSQVIVPSDLHDAVWNACLRGDIDSFQAGQYERWLSEAIRNVAPLEWFPEDGSGVSNEVSLIASDGSIFRPDRVVETGSGIIVIDYKTKDKENRYLRQVRRYMDLYRGMGYQNVRGYLWYLGSGEIQEVK